MNPYSRAPHAGPDLNQAAINAALLIDFDNVTMGMRSDLAKELKHLLDSDVIKGKVTVQRAYADWRRYPQYIVPLSEASIDLIFAPAYGSSKKNATDIRMAIDGMELVFIRPEIGTFILLTGDSDFSSLVLKLKEYGKYVIGIGIQESSSDILVQNCDEYYSYTSVTGLSKTSEGGRPQDGLDPWQCASEAMARMAARGDVMRSDRLKQVMMEMSPGFDERNLGFKKFSKFVAEAANKGLLRIARGANGQYEVALPGDRGEDRPAARPPARPKAGSQKSSGEKAPADGGPNGREPRGRGRKGTSRAGEGGPKGGPKGGARPDGPSEPEDGKDRAAALKLLARAMREFGDKAERGVRDSDVKRKLLALDREFDEGRLGFGKFSKFLHFAEGEGVVAVGRLDGGGFEVRVAPVAELDAKALGLPTEVDSIKSYLANRYKGIGVKTADKLAGSFGTRLFTVMRDEPEKVHALLPKARATRVLAAWENDYQRRSQQQKGRGQASPPADAASSGAKSAPAKSAPAKSSSAPGRRGASSQAPPQSGATVHEPRARHFGRGRIGAKAATVASHAATAKAEAARVAATASRVETAAAPAESVAAPAESVAAPAEAETPAPRKKTASGIFGIFSRGGRGRSGGGD